MQPHNNPNALPAQEVSTKTCSKCGQTKPATTEYFHLDKRYTDGFFCWCKSCRREYGRLHKRPYTKERAEYNRTYLRAYCATHKKQKAEYDRAYRAANKDKINERIAQWFAVHKSKAAEYRRKTYHKNKEVYRAIKLRYRARKTEAEGTYTADDIKRQYKAQKGKCYYCSCKVGDNYHVDHIIPLSRGGSNWPDNLVIACPSCNTSKRDKMPYEWARGGRLL